MENRFIYQSLIGDFEIIDNGLAVTRVQFADKAEKDDTSNEISSVGKEVKKQLDEYFKGKRKKFDLPLEPVGTEYQKKVWNVLSEIPYGKTVTYKEVARMAGNEKASRAVGLANNRNPIPVIVPCHRVIGSNGKLVGYAGGLDKKQRLLELERENLC
jgi:methylated-DNA-[protein]-cysteine S-methyltransferase